MNFNLDIIYFLLAGILAMAADLATRASRRVNPISIILYIAGIALATFYGLMLFMY